MIKGIALVVPKAGISTDAFHRHWRETHGPLALRITSLRRYVQSHRKALAVPGFDNVPFGGVAEIWFDDLATLQLRGPLHVLPAHLPAPIHVVVQPGVKPGGFDSVAFERADGLVRFGGRAPVVDRDVVTASGEGVGND